MQIDLFLDILILFLLGLGGWLLFKILRFPTAAFLGTIIFIGVLRSLQIDIPVSPAPFHIFVQLMLGMYAGSRVTQKAVRQLKDLAVPAIIIIVWSLAVAFGLGLVLSRFTSLDIHTAILSSSMGGLPEMTIIAVALDLNVTVIILMQFIRILLTNLSFPLLIKFLTKKDIINKQKTNLQKLSIVKNNKNLLEYKHPGFLSVIKEKYNVIIDKSILEGKNYFNISLIIPHVLKIIIAVIGGFLFMYCNVPAGTMVGSTIATALASLVWTKFKEPSPFLFNFVLIGAGIIITDNLSHHAVELIISGELFAPIIISIVLTFFFSLLVAFMINKLVKLDFATSFLAAAPGGFGVALNLSIVYNKDPFLVSILHLCRIMTLKILIPIIFASFM